MKTEILIWITNLESEIKGKISLNTEAKTWTWMKTGGAPLFTFFPENFNDLQIFFSLKPKNIGFKVIGASSNMIIKDSAYHGVFIRLTKFFKNIEIKENEIIADSGLLGSSVVNYAIENNLGGFEFIASIPGTIGGLCIMNAGAHGFEMKNIINWIEVMNEQGKILKLSNENCGFQYRSSDLKKYIILKASLKTFHQDANISLEKLNKILDYRKKTQPISGKMAGCFFKNPSNDLKAWELLKQCKTQHYKDLKISEIHANFIVNQNNATSQDVEDFIAIIKQEVFEKHGINLEEEVEFFG